MAHVFTTSYLEDAISLLQMYRQLAEGAMAQVDEEEFFRVSSPEANSIAIIARHVAGNLRSRWTEFLTSDGEKPWRNRDGEFELPADASRAAVMEDWNLGWAAVLGAIGALTEADLARTVAIRGEPHSVLQAINRALAHSASHAGQIVLLAKQCRGERWRTLSIARGQSAEYLRRVQTGAASQR